jgi:hypothetical protein
MIHNSLIKESFKGKNQDNFKLKKLQCNKIKF